MKNKSVHSCRFVHHAKFHCIMTTVNKLFKIEFERGETGKKPKISNVLFSIFQIKTRARIGSFPVSPISNSILKSLFNVVTMQ